MISVLAIQKVQNIIKSRTKRAIAFGNLRWIPITLQELASKLLVHLVDTGKGKPGQCNDLLFDRQTLSGRQADRQTDRQTDIQTDRRRERESKMEYQSISMESGKHANRTTSSKSRSFLLIMIHEYDSANFSRDFYLVGRFDLHPVAHVIPFNKRLSVE